MVIEAGEWGRVSYWPKETQLVNSKPKPRQSGSKARFRTTTLDQRLCGHRGELVVYLPLRIDCVFATLVFLPPTQLPIIHESVSSLP